MIIVVVLVVIAADVIFKVKAVDAVTICF